MVSIQSLFERYGDFKIFRMKGTEAEWKTWKMYSEATEEERQSANLREICQPEIVLDLDEPERVQNVRTKLDQMNWKYSMWKTGSKGFHFHLYFESLMDFLEEERKEIKKYIIAEFGCDPHKQSGMIAIENVQHFKTGKPKEIELVREGHTRLPLGVYLQLELIKKNMNKEWKVSQEPRPIENMPRELHFLFTQGAPKDHRHYTAFRLMMWFWANGWNKEQITEAILEFNQRCKPPKSADIILKHIENTFSRIEMGRYTPYFAPEPEDEEDKEKSFIPKKRSELRSEKTEWIIDNLIPKKGQTLISGQSGVGKSWFCMLLSIALAAGDILLNKFEIPQGKVLYVDEENDEAMIRERLNLIGTDFPEENLLFLVNNFLVMNDETQYAKFIELCNQINPSVIIFDTLARIHRIDENSAIEVNRFYLEKIRPIIEKFNCAVIFMHHEKKGSKDDNATLSSRARGSSEWVNISDAHITIEGADNGFLVIASKIRKAAKPNPFLIKMQQENNQLQFVYGGEVAEKLSEIDACVNSLLKWLDIFANKNDIRWKDMIDSQLNLFTKRTTSRAISILVERGYIHKVARGKYTHHSLTLKTSMESES